MLEVEGIGKTFIMHLRGGAALPVLRGISFTVGAGECVALTGPSGTGKSSLLRMIYGNYRSDEGRIAIRHEGRLVDICRADPRDVIDLRRRTVGYISQFLRVIPRVSTLDIVAAAARTAGMTREDSFRHAEALLTRLNIPSRLWPLAPATFSGGEQQRVNIARGLIGGHRLLLVDEPTASLDAENRDAVTALITEAKERGVTVLGIFHDATARRALADRELDVTRFAVRD